MKNLEKILEEIKDMLEDNKVIELNSDGTLNKCVIDVKLAWNGINDIICEHMTDGWIPVEERLPTGMGKLGRMGGINMQALDKILEEIEQRVNYYRDHATFTYVDICAGLREAEGIIRKHMDDGWIPADERLPEDNNYILLSFENFALPMIGRYKQDAEGGAFYIGNEEETCIRQDLYVNAWMHLPEPYRPEALTGLTCSTAGIMSAGLV